MSDTNNTEKQAGQGDVIDLSKYERYMVYAVDPKTKEKVLFSSADFNAEDLCYLHGQLTMNVMQAAMQAQVAGMVQRPGEKE
jgi:hypothetical protein